MGSQTLKNVIVNCLPQHMRERDLFNMFGSVGKVESCKVMIDLKSGCSLGFGFVNYVRPEDAVEAIRQYNGLEIFNKRIKVSLARPSGVDLKNTNIYVSNLPRSYTEEDLELLFSTYGKIVQKILLVDKITGMKRGVGFVRFNLRDEAEEAIRNLNGQFLVGSSEPLIVRIAEDHRRKRAAYYAGLQEGLRLGREMRYGFPSWGQENSLSGMINVSSGFRPNGNQQ